MKLAAMTVVLALAGTAYGRPTAYAYNGAKMTGTITTGNDCEVGCTPPVVEPVSYSLSGTLTFGSPLGADLVNAPATPEVISFYNGDFGSVVDVTGLGSLGDSSYVLDSASFDFSTDSSGSITGWNIFLSASQPGTIDSAPFFITSTPNGDSASSDSASFAGSYQDVTVSNKTPGRWAIVAAPELSGTGALGGLTLLAGALAVARGRRFNRERRLAARPS
jgi:hypothetical protein